GRCGPSVRLKLRLHQLKARWYLIFSLPLTAALITGSVTSRLILESVLVLCSIVRGTDLWITKKHRDDCFLSNRLPASVQLGWRYDCTRALLPRNTRIKRHNRLSQQSSSI